MLHHMLHLEHSATPYPGGNNWKIGGLAGQVCDVCDVCDAKT
jgi:hypothetical protein